MKVKNKVKFAYIAKVAIKYLYEVMDDIQHNKFIVIFVNASCKVKRGIAFKNYFILPPF